jgi:Tol biopolymer transport system component
MRFGLIFMLLVSSTFAGEEAFLSRSRQLTFEGRRSGEGYFSPDGSKLVFQSEREPGNPFYQIYLLDLETGETTRVSPGTGKTTCAFIQPGTGDILFASTHLDPESARHQEEEIAARAEGRQRRYAWDYDAHFDLFVAPAEGGPPRRLTDAPGYDAEGAFSPEGKRIVFSSTRSAYPLDALSPEDRALAELNPSHFGEIYIMNADGSDVSRLTDHPGYDGGPFFSADGTRIIWRRFSQKGTVADIYTMALDGSDVRRLTDFGAMSWAPYLHPSGDYAIFASNKHGFENFELFIVDAAGDREPVRVTFTPGFDGLPVFSPDGRRLAWTSTRYASGESGAGGQLYIAEWNDAAARHALAAAPPRIAASALPPSSHPASQPVAAADADAVRTSLVEIVTTLASETMEGRMTGTPGERFAADYLSARYGALGLEPLPGTDGFLHAFSFTAGMRPGPGNAMTVSSIEANPHVSLEDRMAEASATLELTAETDFQPLSISDEGTTGGLLAFAGYGLVVPGTGGEVLYDSYGDLDVRGRIVVILRYVPEAVSPELRQLYNRYAGLRYKALQARERGAAGLLVVTGPNSPGAGALVPMSLDFGGVSSGIVAASISAPTADRLLEVSGRSLADLQTTLDSGESIETFTLEDLHVSLTIDLLKESRTGSNVIGYLPGELEGATEEFVVIGAHFDHLGRGRGASSLAQAGEEAGIHYGADDNASGVAAMLEIAARMAREPTRRRSVIFAAWSGEELGLLGSSRFCEDPPVELSRITAYLNLDMVGRVRENQLAVQGVGSSPEWPRLIERRNIAAGFSLTLSDDPYLPTDTTPFYLKGIPVLAFFSGAHEDYHRPSDTAEKVNYDDLARIARFVGSIAVGLADAETAPAFARVERSQATIGGDRDMLRAYLGTIPDYVTEDVPGVKLAGVRAGGPADRAGLREGDIITEFAGQKIANIYDYTYALDAVKIGEPIEVEVRRDGKTLRLSVTPEARQ